jgi:CRISPR-associated endonuclease/helicase Cas3
MADIFDRQFRALTGFTPLSWQRRLFQAFANGDLPSAVDLPTGLGKTSVMALWLLARAQGAKLPRRLV